MQFTPLPRFHRSRLAWSVLLLAAPFAGNLYAADAAPVTPTAGVIAATVNVPTGECRKAISYQGIHNPKCNRFVRANHQFTLQPTTPTQGENK